MNRVGWIWLGNAVSTICMTGVILTVQLAHYPAFHFVDEQRFASFELFHQQRISLIVVPLMLVELGSTVYLSWRRPAAFPRWAAWMSAGLLGLIWSATGLLQVPMHRELENGFQVQTIDRLVASNWIRTVAWAGRAALVVWVAGAKFLPPESPSSEPGF